MSDLIPFIGFWEDEDSLYIGIIFLKATFIFQNNLNEDGKQEARGSASLPIYQLRGIT